MMRDVPESRFYDFQSEAITLVRRYHGSVTPTTTAAPTAAYGSMAQMTSATLRRTSPAADASGQSPLTVGYNPYAIPMGPSPVLQAALQTSVLSPSFPAVSRTLASTEFAAPTPYLSINTPPVPNISPSTSSSAGQSQESVRSKQSSLDDVIDIFGS